MNGKSQWLTVVVVAGFFLAGTGTALAQKKGPLHPPANHGNTSPSSSDPVLAGINKDVTGDRATAHALRAKVEADKRKLKADIAAFGENSPQVAADRAQLRADEQQYLALRRDRRADEGEFTKERNADLAKRNAIIHRRRHR